MITEIETTWVLRRKKEIEQIANKQMNCNFSTNVLLSHPQKRTITLHTNSLELLNHIKKLFVVSDSSEPCASLYFIQSEDISVLEEHGLKLEEYGSAFLGLFDEDKNVALITAKKSYGLLKSVLIGLHSRLFLPAFHPIHGAVFQYKNKGVVLVGNHGAGKTTTLFHLIHYFGKKKFKLMTDDWSIWKQEKNDLSGIALERNISFKKEFSQKFSDLNLEKYFGNKYAGPNSKIFLHPEDLYGDEIVSDNIAIDVVFILNPTNENWFIKEVNSSDAARHIVDSAYHMPQSNEDKQASITFWEHNLQNKKIYYLNWKSTNSIRDFCNKIIAIIE